MKDWRKICVYPEMTIMQTMKVIDENSSRFVAVIDKDDKLIGTVTDGDIRRGILQGSLLQDSVLRVLNDKPFCVSSEISKIELLNHMEQQDIAQVPIIDPNGKVKEIITRTDLTISPDLPYQAVIMVGGLGSRLGDLTSTCPKPLLPVGGRPVLETLLLNLKNAGIREIHLAVNYKSEMIEDYFGNGQKIGLKIDYIKEMEKLGTAGALGIWKKSNNKPFLVMNGDILSQLDVGLLFAHHASNEDIATMCVRHYETQIPFGVVNTDGYRLTSIEEKPVHSCMVSAGIYILDPSCLKYIPENKPLDMPQLFKTLMKDGHRTGVFLIHEYWLDIGRRNDLQKAEEDFDNFFKVVK